MHQRTPAMHRRTPAQAASDTAPTYPEVRASRAERQVRNQAVAACTAPQAADRPPHRERSAAARRARSRPSTRHRPQADSARPWGPASVWTAARHPERAAARRRGPTSALGGPTGGPCQAPPQGPPRWRSRGAGTSRAGRDDGARRHRNPAAAEHTRFAGWGRAGISLPPRSRRASEPTTPRVLPAENCAPETSRYQRQPRSSLHRLPARRSPAVRSNSAASAPDRSPAIGDTD